MKPRLYLAYAAVTIGARVQRVGTETRVQTDMRMLTNVLWAPDKELVRGRMLLHAQHEFPFHQRIQVDVIEHSVAKLGRDWLHWQRIRVKWFLKSLNPFSRVQKLEERADTAAHGEAAEG